MHETLGLGNTDLHPEMHSFDGYLVQAQMVVMEIEMGRSRLCIMSRYGYCLATRKCGTIVRLPLGRQRVSWQFSSDGLPNLKMIFPLGGIRAPPAVLQQGTDSAWRHELYWNDSSHVTGVGKLIPERWLSQRAMNTQQMTRFLRRKSQFFFGCNRRLKFYRRTVRRQCCVRSRWCIC